MQFLNYLKKSTKTLKHMKITFALVDIQVALPSPNQYDI